MATIRSLIAQPAFPVTPLALAQKGSPLQILGALGESIVQLIVVSGHGMAAGLVALARDGFFVVIFNAVGQASWLASAVGWFLRLHSANDAGRVASSSNVTGDINLHVFFGTQAREVVDSNTMIGLVFTGLTSANGIAPDRTIVGVGLATDGQAHAFAW